MHSSDHRPPGEHDAHHGHVHAPGHGHAGHSHGPGGHAPSVTASNARRIQWVFWLTLGYAGVQTVGGWWSGSLALIADAGHMLSDAAALLLALLAYRIAARAPDKLRTYGFQRVRVLAALANGASLLLLVAWISWEAVLRFRNPTEILAGPMLIVAVIGLLVNVAGAWVLMRGHQGDGNLRGALLHVVGDLLGSIGAIAAAVGIMYTGWTLLDPILSVLVSVLVVRSAWSLVWDALLILLQTAPRDLDVERARADVADLPQVAEAGHFHAWTLTDDQVVATIHVTPSHGIDPLTLPKIVAQQLRERHGIAHVTVQVDPPGSLQSPH